MAHAKNEHWWLAVDRHCLVGYVHATYMAVEYDKDQERKAIKERWLMEPRLEKDSTRWRNKRD